MGWSEVGARYPRPRTRPWRLSGRARSGNCTQAPGRMATAAYVWALNDPGICARSFMALAIVQCPKCGAVTPNAEALRRSDWLLPCPPPCDGEREIVEINEHIED